MLRFLNNDLTAIDTSTCSPGSPVSVITFHGTDDPVNPMDGNDDLRWGYTTQTALARWAEIDGITGEPVTSEVSENVTLTAYTAEDGSAEVQLYTVSDGGHTWPGTSWEPPADWATTQEINASELMWSFFSKHSRD